MSPADRFGTSEDGYSPLIDDGLDVKTKLNSIGTATLLAFAGAAAVGGLVVLFAVFGVGALVVATALLVSGFVVLRRFTEPAEEPSIEPGSREAETSEGPRDLRASV